MKKDIYVDYDFQRVGQIVGGKFELKTRAELAALEAEMAALAGPELEAVNGLTVTFDPAMDGTLPTTYQFDIVSLKFVAQSHLRGDLAVDALDFDFSTINVRSGEKVFYTGPAGLAAFTSGVGVTVNVIGEQTLVGNGSELIEVTYVSADALTLIVIPLTRAVVDGAGQSVTFFTTINLTGLGSANTVNHNLGLIDKDAFSVRVADAAGSEVEVDVDSVNVNSLTLTSLVPATNVKVFITGQAA